MTFSKKKRKTRADKRIEERNTRIGGDDKKIGKGREEDERKSMLFVGSVRDV